MPTRRAWRSMRRTRWPTCAPRPTTCGWRRSAFPRSTSTPFASVWPVDAIVAENGAVALVRGADGRIEKRYQQDAATRARNFERMQAVLAHIERKVPGARRATDSAGRECDIAIDHGEFAQLD